MTAHPALIAVHAATAVLCVGLGGYALLRRRKGDTVHRLLGWSWVAGMTFVATSSFVIRDLHDGRLSLLHVLSLVTLTALVLGIRAARRHDAQAHRGNMLGSYLGLLGAFAGAVAVPDRLVPTFVLTQPTQALGALTALALSWAVVVGGAHAVARRQGTSTAGRRRAAAEDARSGGGEHHRDQAVHRGGHLLHRAHAHQLTTGRPKVAAIPGTAERRRRPPPIKPTAWARLIPDERLLDSHARRLGLLSQTTARHTPQGTRQSAFCLLRGIFR